MHKPIFLAVAVAAFAAGCAYKPDPYQAYAAKLKQESDAALDACPKRSVSISLRCMADALAIQRPALRDPRHLDVIVASYQRIADQIERGKLTPAEGKEAATRVIYAEQEAQEKRMLALRDTLAREELVPAFTEG